MATLHIDIETFSSVDIKKSNVYKYSSAPDFEILMAAWSYNQDKVRLAVGEDEIRCIPGLLDSRVLKVAHNAPFERICFSRMLLDEGFLPPEEWEDTQILAAEHGYPQSLDKLAKALRVEEKDSAGTLLINLFCKPRRGRRVFAHEYPEKWEEFCDYCVQDTRTLLEVHEALPSWPNETEREAWLIDQKVNDRGVAIDLELAEVARAAAEDNQREQVREIINLTGVENPNSIPQMHTWLRSENLKLPDLKSETVTKVLETNGLKPHQRRVLELRKELALVTSKKYSAAIRSTDEDGRLRGAFRFYGAHTGRWSGRGVQLHNLTRASIEDPDSAIEQLKLTGSADAQTLKALIRPMLVGPFTVVDYSAIEARVIAWLAGEEWALEAFRNGRDIYVETAERMGGLSRSEGKIAVLALGYQGGVGSLKALGGGSLGSDEKLQSYVDLWRRANQNIVKLWAKMDQAARNPPRLAGPKLKFFRAGKDLRMILPSGRSLNYRSVSYRDGRISFADPKGYRGDTYGGRLAENATQAVARDILSEAIVRLERRGYEVVGHVHDEILVSGEHPVEEVAAVMCELPDWAEGLPVTAEGYRTNRYKKD